ncbi:A/G-specific DNA-adenine glycosylase [Microcella putealis]|uniref:Adenine DNA glycosylase n=1 Tax=Microcella putealis TaxID=337005 RepID=A0A4Q7LXE3_9MICO|nr:A/G-specific adenine glycosylase [Microcella putealis]RZS59122.1 A/G-specific DNA-adenine glycosylase [Microcella putealis]TQM24148.1 A/G-specific DNA-adenine glycosylase [Microcella putealis]
MELSSTIAAWYRENARDLPWRRPGFSPWGVLVSEIMLQQTPVARVIPRLEQWLARWPTPDALAADSPAEAVRAWDRLGYPRRALNLHAAATAIAERHDGEVPADVDALLALPGIGDYTARAVACFAFRMPVPVVDVNTRRVIARAVHGQGAAGPARTRPDLAAMAALLPDGDAETAHDVNAGAMELGQTICTARAPECDACPIAELCAWRAAGYPVYDGPLAPRQARFEGSDRQVRGIIMRALRSAESVSHDEVETLWPDAVQRERALAGLLADGLAVGDPETGYRLPGA